MSSLLMLFVSECGNRTRLSKEVELVVVRVFVLIVAVGLLDDGGICDGRVIGLNDMR